MRRLTRSQVAIGVLIAIPVLAFVIAAAVGHMSINGDNNLQNFPLRVLVGKDLASGQLPLWNPYMWSGTPLLASFNAGAVYPLTLLFAILPSIPAWILTQIALYSITAVGTFAFFRSSGRSVAASLAAAACFSFAGFLSSQIGHVDTIEAAAWLPWLLFALRRLALAERHRGCWAALLGAGVGIVIVSASPETIMDDGIVVAFYAIWLCIQHRERTRSIVTLTLVAGVLGLLLGAVQWVPGLDWEAQSQRVGAIYSFFASGSLPPRLTILSVVPWLLGGYGNFGGAGYAGPYNLAELNGYVGMVPLMAASGLLASRFRHHPKRGEWLGWYLLGALGLVLAWGGLTPIGHILYHIPVYGQQRDQSRNLILVDLALAGLLASWIDVAIAPLRGRRLGDVFTPELLAERAKLSAEGRWPVQLRSSEIAWALLPVAVVAMVWVYFMVDPTSLAAHLGVFGLVRIGAAKIDLTISLGIALAAGASVVVASRLMPAVRMAAIGGVITLDLLVFCTQQYTFMSSSTALLTGTGASEKAVAKAAGPGARVAFWDPQLLPSLTILEYLGLPDYNITEQVSSINGYGSLVDGAYETGTGTHDLGALDLGAIANGTLEQLDVGILATPSPSLQAEPQLDAALTAGGWTAAGTDKVFDFWRPTRTEGPIWTISEGQSPKPGALVEKLERGSQGSWSAVVSSPAPVEVVRSVAYAPGWSAVLSSAHRPTRTVAVVRRDLVQSISVPAGVTHIKWEYNAPGLGAGVTLTAAGALGMASLALADTSLGSSALGLSVLRRRRRRPREELS